MEPIKCRALNLRRIKRHSAAGLRLAALAFGIHRGEDVPEMLLACAGDQEIVGDGGIAMGVEGDDAFAEP